ncbi:hypothetical protein AAHC03_01610 [Spirometra sp. Aus1]
MAKDPTGVIGSLFEVWFAPYDAPDISVTPNITVCETTQFTLAACQAIDASEQQSRPLRRTELSTVASWSNSEGGTGRRGGAETLGRVNAVLEYRNHA